MCSKKIEAPPDRYSPFALFVIFVASIGGFLFGYHAAITSGILDILAETFHLELFQKGFLISILLLGGIAGALLSGPMADKWGRKLLLLINAAFFIIGSILLATAKTYVMFLIARFISGFGVGLASVLVPIYLAEVAPPHYRGRFVCLYQMMITIGIVVAYGVNALFAHSEGWRFVLGLSFIPAVLQLITVILIPESPSWLIEKRHLKRAAQAFSKLRRDVEWKKHISEIESTVKAQEKRGLDKHVIYVVLIGLGLSIFQQITGINTIIFYAPTIFKTSSAVSAESALISTLIVGIANCLATLVAIWLVDKVGRRILLLIGVFGMMLSLIALGLSSKIEGGQQIALISTIAYVIGFAISLGPVTWVVLSEIFPLHIRGMAMGLALFFNWLFNYIVSLTFLLLIESWGLSWTFLFYALICIGCFAFIYFLIPETKGKSLEEIAKLFTRKKLKI
jgi:sugar porter (SP) family MFS transporter